MFVTFDNNLPCHCEPFSSLSLRAKRGNPIGAPPRLLSPDKSGLATTEGGHTEITEPVPKRKQGISARCNDKKECNQGVERGHPLYRAFQTMVYYEEFV